MLTRGLWLILLEIVAISPVWGLGFGKVYLATLWAIGLSMVVLAGLIWLPPRVVLLIGSLNSRQPQSASYCLSCVPDFGSWAPFWTLLHEQGPLPWGIPGRLVYPVLPWIGVMALGYGLGPVFLTPAAERRRILSLLGSVSIALFVLLRASNVYGDPGPWSVQGDPTM